MINPIQQKRLENTLLIAKSFGLVNDIKKSEEYFTEDSLLAFAQDLQKGLDDGSIDNDYFEKAVKDLTQLQKKIITNSQGHQQTVYVRVHEDGAEHHFKHEDKVRFTHGGKEVVGHIKSLKHHEKFDKFGTAEIHDKDGNKYSKSLRQIEHHHVPEESETKSSDEKTTVKSFSGKYTADDIVSMKVTKDGRRMEFADGTWRLDASPKEKKIADEYEANLRTGKVMLHGKSDKKAVVSTDKPIGATISDIGAGGKEHNTKTIEPDGKTSISTLKKHSMYSKEDYDHLSGKGYSNDEIKKIWDSDDKRGENPIEVNTTKSRKTVGEGSEFYSGPKAEDKPKMSGVEAINAKQAQLKKIQDQIKNHDTGVNKLDSSDLHNLKEKARLIQTIINKLSDKVDSREGSGAKK